MPNSEWEEVKEALRKPPTSESMREAAEAFRRWRIVKLQKHSKPTLVSLGYRKPYPSAIPVDKIPDELERNPAFFELMKKVIAKER